MRELIVIRKFRRDLHLSTTGSAYCMVSIVDNVFLEEEYFGPIIGSHAFFQLRRTEYYDQCLAKNSIDNDSTGCRVYQGAHVLIRFLACEWGQQLMKGKRILEVGAGCGAVGLLGDQVLSFKELLLTDGNDSSVRLIERNIAHFKEAYQNNIFPGSNEVGRISSQSLLWTRDPLIASSYNSKTSLVVDTPFDVVLGCELFYYRVDILALLTTVIGATAGSGIFVHCHIVRDDSLEAEMNDFLRTHGWLSISLPVHRFVSHAELAQHPEWFQCCLLVSGPIHRVELLLTFGDNGQTSEWTEFTTSERACEANMSTQIDASADSIFGNFFDT